MARATQRANAGSVNELAALVRSVNDAGVSYGRMEARARDRGHEISSQYFQMVAKGRIKRPKSDRLAAIAAGLPNITETQVREAAARQSEVHVEHNINYQMSNLLALVQEMSPTSRERWYRLATAIAQELAAEEVSPPRTVVIHDQTQPTEHTRRVLQRELDEIASHIPPTREQGRPGV